MKIFSFFTFLVLLLAVSVFAAETDRGIIGTIIFDLINNVPILGRLAVPIFGLIMVAVFQVLEILGRKIHDMLPVVWRENGVSLYWRIAALLFGDEVIVRNARLDPECPHAAAEALRKRVIDKSPILQTKVPWGK